MKLAPVPQNPLEWFALKTGLVPTPLAYSHFGFLTSKIILEAVDKGVFEAIGHHQPSVDEVARSCNLNNKALQSLLGALASLGLVDYKNDRLILTKQSKKWLLTDSPNSLYWMMMFDNKVCLKWMDYVGEFLETGKGLQYHETFNDEEWFYYQKAMEATASAVSKEIVSKIPMPAGATHMLDIGGAHGLYSIKLCKKYKGLQSVILDLPAAVEKAKPLLDKHNMPQIKHVSGNVLTDELEVLRHDNIKLNGDMLASMGNFFFALSSTSGAWSLKEIKSWQQEAGFAHYKKSTFLTIPGYVSITAVKK